MNISIFGLGIIGSRCADNLAKAGHSVTTWNRTPKDRDDSVADAAAAAKASEVLAFYLKDGKACRETFESIRPALTSAHTIINHSTIDLDTTKWLATECEKLGIDYLDCPFTGSKVAAHNGELVYYFGGNTEVLEKFRPVLEVTSKEIIPLGKVGDATVVKIATNLISASTVQALSEAMAIASAHGVSPETFIPAVTSNACGSPLAAMKLPTMASGDYDTHFSLDNMRKDSVFARELAKEAKLNTPGIDATSEMMTKLCDQGLADLDYSALYKQFDV
ncbi:2-hydroxy-3-oxopropionate reductase [Rubritalea squalenifaciens DSM 18772]|uniref:2-hydroxy-3-oxopropionate reductase n=1 Tax=Rubritalea squalenifaciens DSM 18772 TaxID=1123071 RepID=A0A1M6NWE7_9BACT|nr:NAD(P)-dependent oxidoreductase [Rubritalea squalenifaciens]SHJ99954.1 2-hydroxy-3-oxopropionate reductase [Rubritalea squalenifaciens DSM 18772]